jgi:hypothetical protein
MVSGAIPASVKVWIAPSSKMLVISPFHWATAIPILSFEILRG